MKTLNERPYYGRYNEYINEAMTADQLDYLTVVCSTRPRWKARLAKKLIARGEYAQALKLADPIAYNVGFNEFE